MSTPQDRRQTPRFSFEATATLKTPEGPQASRLRVLGIGLAGCRIVTHLRLETEQEFELTIQPDGEEIVARVVVKYWRPKGVAGLHFTSMSEEAKKRLEALVKRISQALAAQEAEPES